MTYRMDPKITGFDRIKYLLVALGGAAVGGVVMFGPAELREEIPWHRELGMGFIAFAALMLAALFFVRAKALLLAIVSGLVAAGAIFTGAAGEDLATWQRGLFILLGAGGGIFAIACLVSVFSGEDPSA